MKAVMEDMEIVEGFKMALDQVWNQLYIMRSAWRLIIKEATNKDFLHDSKHLSHALNHIKKDKDNDKQEEKMYVYIRPIWDHRTMTPESDTLLPRGLFKNNNKDKDKDSDSDARVW